MYKQKYIFNIGDVYSHWTVIGEAKGGKVLCQCDCENKTIRSVGTYDLVNGKTTSCGCARKRYEVHEGDKFGKLTVIQVNARKNVHGIWLHKCQCDCEAKSIRYKNSTELITGRAVSCGCRIRIHLDRYTRFYKIWHGMKNRCLYIGDINYKNYGGRGIGVCDKWLNYLGFKEDMYESYQKHVEEYGEKDTTLDRIDVNGNYCKENCRWATKIEQSNNRTNNRYLMDKDGIKHTIYEWARIKGINPGTLKSRIRKGLSDIEALNTPVTKPQILTDSQGNAHTISEWSKIVGIDVSTIRKRVNKKHWEIDKALYTPTRKRGRI